MIKKKNVFGRAYVNVTGFKHQKCDKLLLLWTPTFPDSELVLLVKAVFYRAGLRGEKLGRNHLL